MNYIRQLSAFFEKASSDMRLNPSHVSLYMALFQFWNMNRFENPISINRGQAMRLSKIGSSHTYLKCLNELHLFGYIKYHPSHNPLKGSLVYLCIFDTSTEQVLHNNLCNNGTSTEQALHPSINSINIINKYREEQSQNDNPILNPELEENSKRKKLAPKKESSFVKPQLEEIMDYFIAENYPKIEAQKFFNHFESNGWKVGGKTPMKNWQAAARNWMLNIQNFVTPKNFPSFQKPQQKPKHDPNNKNYSEPL